MIVAAYQGFSPEGNIKSALATVDKTPVSYTHLTLPTILLV